jgi:hypothetical protein
MLSGFSTVLLSAIAFLSSMGAAFADSCSEKIGKEHYGNLIYFYSVPLPKGFTYHDAKRPGGAHGFYGEVSGLPKNQLNTFAEYVEAGAAGTEQSGDPDLPLLQQVLGSAI